MRSTFSCGVLHNNRFFHKWRGVTVPVERHIMILNLGLILLQNCKHSSFHNVQGHLLVILCALFWKDIEKNYESYPVTYLRVVTTEKNTIKGHFQPCFVSVFNITRFSIISQEATSLNRPIHPGKIVSDYWFKSSYFRTLTLFEYQSAISISNQFSSDENIWCLLLEERSSATRLW